MYGVLLLCLTVTTSVVLISAGCPVKRCEWFPWNSWSDCSRTCGGGTRWRSRSFCCNADLNLEGCLKECKYEYAHFYNDGYEDGICNQFCLNGGTFIQQENTYNWNCKCHGFNYGVCCENVKKGQPSGQEKCSATCDWMPWGSWGPCSVSCGGGGNQERVRDLCCPEDYSNFQTCAWLCGKNVVERTEERVCGSNCLLGGTIKTSGYGCDCLNRTFGHCCEQLLPGCTPFPTDVIFVLDSSVSQTKEQFKKQLDFIHKFVDNVNISREEFQVAVVTYSTYATVDINFNQASDKNTLKHLIDRINFRPGATFTDKGLKAALEVARKSERRVGMVSLTYAFVLTDGMSNKRIDTRVSATSLKNANVHVIAIGIGKEVSHQELIDIASPGDSFSPSYVFSVGDFNALDTLLKQLVQVTCNDCSEVSHLSDILFLIDESSPMTEEEFQLSIDVMSTIVQSTNNIGEVNGKIFAVVQVARTIDTIIQFSDEKLQNQNDLQIKFQSLHRSQTDICVKDESCIPVNITSAITNIYENLFKQDGRQNSRKFLLVLSNGRFQDPVAVKSEIEDINSNSDVKLFAIGPGLDVDINGLLLLAKEANHVYVTLDNNDLSKLDILQSEFSYNVCSKT